MNNKITKSLVYLLPILGFNSELYGDKLYNAHINSNDNMIYIVIHQKISDIKHIEIIKNIDGFKGVILNNKNYTILSFEIPKEKLSDFEKFKNGKYSKFSKEYKKKIINFWKTHPATVKNIFSVLYPTLEDKSYLKKSLMLDKDFHIEEILSVPDIEKEVLNTKFYEHN